MDKQEPENVIYAYTDAEACDDGVLVAIRHGPVNRVTRAVFIIMLATPPQHAPVDINGKVYPPFKS